MRHLLTFSAATALLLAASLQPKTAYSHAKDCTACHNNYDTCMFYNSYDPEGDTEGWVNENNRCETEYHNCLTSCGYYEYEQDGSGGP